MSALKKSYLKTRRPLLHRSQMAFDMKPIQVGETYFITTNIDVSDGLFNGATGVLKHIQFGSTSDKTKIPNIAWMKFENPQIGNSNRSSNCSKYSSETPEDWTPIMRYTRTLSKSYKYPGMELIRTQIPLVAANGMTIAKAQGSSMPLVVFSTKRKLNREKLYVACSRATSLNGFYISGNFTPPDSPGEDNDVTVKMKLLRNNVMQYTLQYFHENNKNKSYYHNVENFHKYQMDLCSDPNIMSINLILFVEPHLHQYHTAEIPGFTCVSRKNAKTTNNLKNSEGYLVFLKDGKVLIKHIFGNVYLFINVNLKYFTCNTFIGNILGLVQPVIHPAQSGRHSIEILDIKYESTTKILCYKHPSYSIIQFLHI